VKRVVIDGDMCTGHGRCYTLAPSVFEPDDVGYGVVLSPRLTPELEEEAQLALANCPEHAISIVDTPT
jgi:ferredoxin